MKVLSHQARSDTERPESERTRFRGLVARANVLAADRPDIVYSVKEICRIIAKPTEFALQALKRLGRYMNDHPRMVFSLPFHEASAIEVYSDTDWGGCVRTRKSMSGGCMMIGSHVTNFWSSTQASLALSSGEAEYYGVVRATSIGLGHQALFRDAGLEIPARVWTDSSAAKGTSARQGLGKLRHLECHSRWLQQRLKQKQLQLLKVPGEENPADLFTKLLESERKLTQLISVYSIASCEKAEPSRHLSSRELRK